jgi:hypothetical protein
MASVIYCEELGVFLGTSDGLFFWSGTSSGGLDAAPVFDSPAEASEFVHAWPMHVRNAIMRLQVRFVEVVPDVIREDGMRFASSGACVMAGVPAWISELPIQLYEPIYGMRPTVH